MTAHDNPTPPDSPVSVEFASFSELCEVLSELQEPGSGYDQHVRAFRERLEAVYRELHG